MPEAQARSKIKEAQHFLGEMRHAQELLREDLFRYSLSAFLAAWRSVPEFVLYDYAEKNSLGISREDEERMLVANQFKIAANVIMRLESNTEPLRFMQWWLQRCNAIYREHGIVDKRNYTIHKGYPKVEKVAEVERMAFVPTGSFGVYTSGSTYFVGFTSGTYTTTGPSGSGTYTTTGPSSVTLAPMDSAAPANVTETFRFHDQLDKDIVDICEEACDDMNEFVMKAESGKWKEET